MTQFNGFDHSAYLAANKDVEDWWTDASKAGIHSGQGVYQKSWGVNTDGWEDQWVKGMNKKYNTQHTDVGGFSRDQFAKYHYGSHGIHENRNLRPTEVKKAVQPNPNEVKNAVQPKPKTDPNAHRMAGSEEFKKELNNSMRPGRTARPPQRGSQVPPAAGGRHNKRGKNYGATFEQQAQRENQFDNFRFNKDMKQSNQILSRYSNANRVAQRGRSDGSSIANKYIFNASQSNPIDIVALDKHIRRGPLYHEGKSEVAGLLTYGDKYRNARENLSGWSQPNPMEGVERPDFGSIYKKTKDDIDSIKL